MIRQHRDDTGRRAGAAPVVSDRIADRAESLSRVSGAWSLHFLKLPWLVLAGGAVVAIVVAVFFGTSRELWGIGIGALIVGVFFSLSSLVVAKVGELNDRYTLPAALAIYILKLVVLAVVLLAVPGDAPVSREAMGITIAVGAMVWIATHVWVVLHTPMLYVDPSVPPARPTPQSRGPVTR